MPAHGTNRAVVKRIIIAGGGFAAIAAAQRLERKLRSDEAEIVLISRENFSVFTPMLPEVSSGALEARHVATPIRAQLHRTRFILADVETVDLQAHAVTYRHILTGVSEQLSYAQLILAIGSATSTFGLPGVAEHVFALKTLEDAGILRNRFMWLLELADSVQSHAERKRLLTLVVVGGGFTGVEATGEMVELFKDVARFFPHIVPGDVRIVLVEGGPVLLAGLPKRMGTYAHRDLVRRGVEVITGDAVASADENGLDLQSGRRIETRTIVWSAGVRAIPLPGTQALERGKGGRFVVGADMRAKGRPDIWAAGDCAAIPQPHGGTYAQTAQHAIREGPVLADNVIAALRGLPTRPFIYSALGMMASLGARKAVAQLPGDRVLTGFLAWFLWRTYYLARLPGIDRKLRVAFDWTLALIFPRDISELRIYTQRSRSSAAADAGLVPRDEAVVK